MVITSYLSSSFAQNERDNAVVLNAILADEGRWEQLIESAREPLELRHPDLNIEQPLKKVKEVYTIFGCTYTSHL